MTWLKRLFAKPSRRSERTPEPRAPQEAAARQLRIDHALAQTQAEHPLWLAVLEIVDEHERNMLHEVLLEKSPNEVRQYDAGRAASARLLANAFRDLKAAAEIRIRKQKEQG